ncbi:hypothetical protein WDJ51_01070 [Rathayibacter sp. YIM 133350]|uniref:hypothetical protein n=1 Tax=Rathayibacter sp. YIM 133350 TaxID=3131992 RepID=UPI00307E405B
MTSTAPASPTTKNRVSGAGRVLIVVYAILALGATGRSMVQIIERFDVAPLAFTLSAFSALVYIVATVALILRGRTWYRVAWAAIGIEAAGVLIVGTLSLIEPSWFPEATVWSFYGMGYLFVPLVLPWIGMWWLAKHRPGSASSASVAADA